VGGIGCFRNTTNIFLCKNCLIFGEWTTTHTVDPLYEDLPAYCHYYLPGQTFITKIVLTNPFSPFKELVQIVSVSTQINKLKISKRNIRQFFALPIRPFILFT
jgi:hypothetical protein